MIKYINEKEFKEEVLKENKLVVVDFFASWCGPCKMLSPILEELQKENEEIKVVKMDIDDNPNVVVEYGVQSIPTLKLFKGGEEVATKVGFLPKNSLIELIEKEL